MRVLEITAGKLNVREGPGTGYTILEVLPRGTLLIPVTGWLPVEMDDGTVGWVSAQYVKEAEGEEELTPKPIPVEGDPPWMTVARKYLGISETAGTAANPQIINFFLATSFKPTRGDEDPWCSAFACAAMEEAGYRSTRNALAISWQDWGQKTEPRLGAVVVFPHHVGFFDSWRDDGRINLLGGNQSNSVNITPYNATDVVAYRWPV